MLTISDLTPEDCVILPEHKISKSSCKISNGEAFFEYDNDQTLVVKVSLFFEDFSCKFETAFSCTEIPGFQASLIKKPSALFKQIMDKKLFPKDFTVFFEPQEKKKLEQNSSKLTEVKHKNLGGKEKFASGSDEGGRFSISPFRSPKKGRSSNEEISSHEETQSNPESNSQTRKRAKSHAIRREERKARSSLEISTDVTIQKTSSLKEPLHNKTLRISPREKIEKSEKIHNLSPKAHRTSSREILQNLTGKPRHHPPHDESQGSSLDSSPRLYVELEESKSDGSKIVDESAFIIPNVTNGEGRFTLYMDGTLNMKLQVIFEKCLWEIERNYSLLEQARINFNASMIKDPLALFGKVIEKRHLVSENFNPFFCPQRKIVEAVDDFVHCTEKASRAEVPNSSDSREVMTRPVSKSVGHLSIGNPKIQEANIEMDLKISKYRSLIQSARDNYDRLSDIYFGSHIGRVPPLPKQLYDDLALPWKGQTVAETHSFYLVFEKMNGRRTCFGNFGEAVQRPAKGKEIYRMDLSSSNYSDAEFTDLAETPYWILITNDPIEGTVGKTPEELDEILFKKGGGKHNIPNLVEMGIHKASEYINHKQFNNLNVLAVCAETKNLNGKEVNMVMKHGSKNGELIVTAASEPKGNEVYYGVIRYLSEKKI